MSDKITESKEAALSTDAVSELKSQDAAEVSGTQWTTSRWEIWSFYAYYIVSLRSSAEKRLTIAQGNNGLSGYDYGPSQFQNLINRAGYDAAKPPFTTPCGADSVCVLPFIGKVRSITQVVLINNRSCFAIQRAFSLQLELGPIMEDGGNVLYHHRQDILLKSSKTEYPYLLYGFSHRSMF
jgi:hypothetical protein